VRFLSTPGQTPELVAQAAVRQVRRAIKRPETRVAVIESLRPYRRGQGHEDMNGDELARPIHQMVRAITFYREPAGDEYAGEVVQSPTLTLAINGGDCDDLAVVAATAAAVFGCEAAIGWYDTDPAGRQAHIVAAIRPGWYRPGDWVVIDAQKKEPTDPKTLAGVSWLRV
jgi:hypothetical protein